MAEVNHWRQFPIASRKELDAAMKSIRPHLMERLFGARFNPRVRARRRIIKRARDLGILGELPLHWRPEGRVGAELGGR